MTTIELTSYGAHDMPACLAAVGMVRALTRYASCPARLSWGQAGPIVCPTLHLPAGVDQQRLADMLRTVAAARADSPHWSLIDTCDDGAAWEAAVNQVVAAGDRDGADLLAGVACYMGGEGGRSPLICVSRNMTLGRWAQQSVTAAAETDWPAHFREWSTSGSSWQGWRWHGDARSPGTRADPAAVWLAIEGLPAFPCSQTAAWERPRPEHLDALADVEGRGVAPPDEPAARRDVLCPGWDFPARRWRFPLWDSPAGLDAIRSLVASPRIGRHVTFRRSAKQAGNYHVSEFGPGVVGRDEESWDAS